MNVSELRATLVSEGYPGDTYSLDGSTPKFADDAFILSFVYGNWIIEWIERGVRTEDFRSPSEDAACRKFLEIMRRFVK